jgi:hypothetical protein
MKRIKSTPYNPKETRTHFMDEGDPCPSGHDNMKIKVTKEDGEKPKVEVKEPKVNRPKAITFAFLFGALQFCYMIIFKGKVRGSGVDPSDFMFIRCLVVFFWTTIAIFTLK